MEAKARPIGKLLEERTRFTVPIYQRHYEWERNEQWEPLWNDIQDKADEVLQGTVRNFAHYMGALILSEGKAKLGEVPVKQVIDGQQRLTTFQLFLNALKRVATEKGLAKLSAVIENNLTNDKPQLMEQPEIERYKLWPTRYDRTLYADVIDLSFATLRDKYPAFYFKNGSLVAGQAPRVLAALYFFYEAIHDSLKADPDAQEDRLNALSDAVLNHFSIVVISLDDEDDAQTIFATLNARGKPLSAMDLIRNDIFQRAPAGKGAEALFDKKWSPEFEDRFWDVEERQGRLTRKRIEYFLANILAAERAEVINLSKIYPEYKQFVKVSAFKSVDEELDRLLDYAPAYRGLRNIEGTNPLNRIARHLSDWDITTAFPLVMSAELSMKNDPDSLSQFYSILEAYTIRRAYCGLTTKGYNNFFLAAIKGLREMGWSSGNFGKFLIAQTAESARFPSDEEFKTAVVTQKIYRQGWERRTRVILEALEQALRTSKDDVIQIQSGFTIEHVMPAKWAKHWPLPGGKIAPTQDFYTALVSFKMSDGEAKEIRDRESILDTIGNLTLVTQPLNTAISNGPFVDKRLELARSALILNREIVKEQVWAEAQVAGRGLRLAEVAAILWQRPDGSKP
jgi:uncharacterized protein with ParB-like and HNH nuclease domain